MPANDRVWTDYYEGIAYARTAAIQPKEERTINAGLRNPVWQTTAQDVELMAENKDF